MRIEDIYELMDRFESSGLSEMKLEMEGIKLEYRKNTGSEFELSTDKIHGKQINCYEGFEKKNLRNTNESGSSVGASINNGNSNVENNLHDINEKINACEVKAKIAGTFYRAASPESEPFIQVGQSVKKGDVIGLIEAMKMMNDIVSPVDGKVVDIVAKNEELVGFDDLLVIIDEETN